MRAIAFAICLVLGLVIVDPSSSHAFIPAFSDITHSITAVLSAHPFEAALGTAFAIDPLDKVMTLSEWRTFRRISAATERRLRKAGLGPKLIYISAGLLGVRVRDDREWMDRGGASGAPVPNADPPMARRRNTGRDTTKAIAARVAKRRKATTIASPLPSATEPLPPQHTTTTAEAAAEA